MEAIKEIGIFIVIAQAILYFVPGESYVKYVKVIIGVIMIAKMAQPVLTFINGGEWEQLLEQAEEFGSLTDFEESNTGPEDNSDEIREQVEKELADKLNEKPFKGYIVSGVLLDVKEEKDIVIMVSEEKEETVKEIKIEEINLREEDTAEDEGSKPMEKETEELKAYYGEILGTDPDNLEVKIN